MNHHPFPSIHPPPSTRDKKWRSVALKQMFVELDSDDSGGEFGCGVWCVVCRCRVSARGRTIVCDYGDRGGGRTRAQQVALWPVYRLPYYRLPSTLPTCWPWSLE